MSGGTLIRTIVLLAALAAALTACGRRGALDTPYEAALEAREEAADADEPVPPEPSPPRDRRFILDGLI